MQLIIIMIIITKTHSLRSCLLSLTALQGITPNIMTRQVSYVTLAYCCGFRIKNRDLAENLGLDVLQNPKL